MSWGWGIISKLSFLRRDIAVSGIVRMQSMAPGNLPLKYHILYLCEKSFVFGLPHMNQGLFFMFMEKMIMKFFKL